MFRITGFCEDKHLPDILRALSGKMMNLEAVPVVNASKGRDGKLSSLMNGDLVNAFMAHAAERKIDACTRPGMKAWLLSIGKSERSLEYFVNRLLHYKAVRKTGKGKNAKYILNPEALAAHRKGK